MKENERPAGVWIIFILNLALIPFLPLDLYYSLSRNAPESIPQLAVSLIIQAGNLVGAFHLFLLRKDSIYFFAAALTLNVIASITIGLQNRWYLFVHALGWVISLAIIWYSWSLKKKRVLR